jgi:hypothetical protein
MKTPIFYVYSVADKPALVGTFRIREHADAFIRDLEANGKQVKLIEAELITEESTGVGGAVGGAGA